MSAGRLLRAKGVYGFWPAASDGDDIMVYADDARQAELARLHTLRQQWERKGGRPFYALADFIAPLDSGRSDYMGGFRRDRGARAARNWSHRFEADHDDYNAIMAKALADRLAEAFAERLHQVARREWGYGREEQLTATSMIAEKYRGIRPAPGYPACPDHTEKRMLFDCLARRAVDGHSAHRVVAMTPPASVCGLYFAHPGPVISPSIA